jgi:hypothetical protein
MRFELTKLSHRKGLHLVDTCVALFGQRRQENCNRFPLGSICVTNAEFNAGKSQRGFHSKELIAAEVFAIRDGHVLRSKVGNKRSSVLRSTKPRKLYAADHGFVALG